MSRAKRSTQSKPAAIDYEAMATGKVAVPDKMWKNRKFIAARERVMEKILWPHGMEAGLRDIRNIQFFDLLAERFLAHINRRGYGGWRIEHFTTREISEALRAVAVLSEPTAPPVQR